MRTINEETRRILQMVENGQISAADGAKLLDSTPDTFGGGSTKCPFCAETIVPVSGRCPECKSALDQSRQAPEQAGGFHSLTGRGKFLVVYTLLVCGFWIVSSLLLNGNFFRFSAEAAVGGLLAILGIAAGVMILKGNPTGWNLGITWSALQIVTIISNYEIINQQVFHLGANQHTNGSGMGVNLVGIILLILFIKAKAANSPARTTVY